MERTNRTGFTIVLFVLAAGLTGCDESSSPTSPLLLGHVFGEVMTTDGVCLSGATITIVDGPDAGMTRQQSDLDCQRIAQEEWVWAFRFADLSSTQVTLRASKTGYQTQTVVAPVRPTNIGNFGSRIEIRLAPEP